MKRLYEAADSFRRLAPWKWMDDDRIFGVKNPETGGIDYCGVLGALGEVFALIVYSAMTAPIFRGSLESSIEEAV